MTGGGAGALASAMLSAAVASRADPVRFGRGRAYVREGAVVDMATVPGLLTASVAGSRAAPYRVTVRVAGSDDPDRPAGPDAGAHGAIDVRRLNELVPDADELHCSCTCPDGPADPCKHAVAALLAFADQVAIEPELLVEWRSGPPADVDDEIRTGRRGPSSRWSSGPDDSPPDPGSGGQAAAESVITARTPEEAAFLGDPDDVVTDLPDLELLPVGAARVGAVDLAAIVADALELIRSTYDHGRR
jgi:hypothetical protein